MSGLLDRLTQADLLVVDAAEGDHRRAGALRTEARKGLRVAALEEGRHRQHFRSGDNALTTAAMNAYLNHAGSVPILRSNSCTIRSSCVSGALRSINIRLTRTDR